MPYEGDRLSMLIILPDGRDGMSGLDSTVSTMQIERWKQDMRPQEIIVSVPKFTTKAHYDLMGPLSSLGVSDVFDLDMADLSGIAYVPPDQSLYVTKAIHDAYVDVSEEGTEAAAVTTIVGTLEESLSPRPQWFNANHPVHIHNTGRRERGDPVHGKAVGSYGVAWGSTPLRLWALARIRASLRQ